MAKNLIIVESPSKTKKIATYVGGSYLVKSSVGHFMELDKVDPKTYTPTYKVISEKKSVLKELKDAAKKVTNIYLATDPDREGEAIAWHLYNQLSSINNNIYRITFNEITKKAINDALSKPTKLDDDLVDAAKARQILDRFVGYKVSPLVWQAVAKAKSAGRVQSPTLRLIVDRQKEIDAFKPVTYWTITALVKSPKGEEFPLDLVTKDRLEDKRKVDQIVQDLKKANYQVTTVESKTKKGSPYPPFDTSSLQQAASAVFNWPAKKTSSISQKLYQAGHISYIRTDSFAISDDALKMARGFITSNYHNSYLPSSSKLYKKKSKSVKEQGAHECIRPTDLSTPPTLSGDEQKLYNLIKDRFVACQMSDAKFKQTEVKAQADKYKLKASGKTTLFNGYLEVWGKYSSTKDVELPELKDGDSLTLVDIKVDEHTTKPPPAYTHGSLVKKLEDEGIGRPSTYASIIDLISSDERNYVVMEKSKFKPTDIGKDLVEFLVGKFAGNFIEYKYTSNLENFLDDIANGNKNWLDVLKEFDDNLKSYIKEAREKIAKEKQTGIVCPKCGKGNLLVRNGKFGQFYGCENWKSLKCDYTAQIGENGEPIEKQKKVLTKSKHKCPECSDYLVERENKNGDKFLGCANYPKCSPGIFDTDGNLIKKSTKKSSKKGTKKKSSKKGKSNTKKKS